MEPQERDVGREAIEAVAEATANEYLQRTRSRCGHPERCRKCKKGEKHGEYWYFITRNPDTRKLSRVYAGKYLKSVAGASRDRHPRFALARHLVRRRARNLLLDLNSSLDDLLDFELEISSTVLDGDIDIPDWDFVERLYTEAIDRTLVLKAERDSYAT